MVKPASFLPEAGTESEPEFTREMLEEARRRKAKPPVKAPPVMTRRSWYVDAAVADAFQAAVDDIHHATRTPKHQVLAALLQAAVDQGDRVQKKLTAKGSQTSQ